MFILPRSWVIMLLYDSFTIALRYSVKLTFSQFARELQRMNNLASIVTRSRNLTENGNWTKCRTFRVRSQIETEDQMNRTCRTVLDLPGQKSNWNSRRSGRCSLKSGSLNILGGWSFHPILRFCFSRTRPLWYLIISINFISCQFSSFFSK